MVNMATKEELLKEKTVKDLKQMARDKDLSGYSKMRKNELIEFIGENYSKDEVKAWSESEDTEKEDESEERKCDDEELAEATEEAINEIPKSEFSNKVKSPDTKMVIVAVILIVIIAVAIAMGI